MATCANCIMQCIEQYKVIIVVCIVSATPVWFLEKDIKGKLIKGKPRYESYVHSKT